MVRHDRMEPETHLQQFHNADHYGLDTEYSVPNWWELGDSASRTERDPNGSVISQLRGYKRGGTVSWHDKLRAHMNHSARHVPGLHIDTSEVGEPMFTGKL